MPFQREIVMVENEAVADSGTYILDLDITDPLTRLEVGFYVTNGASVIKETPPASVVSKIEVVDGGMVLYSLTGQEALAAGAYDLKVYPSRFLTELANNPQLDNMVIAFGRYMGDREYAFDPRKFRNPQLRVTWAKASGHLTGGCKLRVSGTLLEGIAAPTACLLWKEIESFTSTASGEHVTELPTDWPYDKLMVRAYISTANMINIITRLKLDCDSGKYVPFDFTTEYFMYRQRAYVNDLETEMQCVRDDGERCQHWMGNGAYVGGNNCGGSTIVGVVCSGMDAINAVLKTDAGAAASAVPFMMHPRGHAFESTYMWPFGRSEVADDWFSASTFGSIKLRLTQGLASGAVGVAVRQARPY